MLGHIYYSLGLISVFIICSMILKFRKNYSLSEWKEKYEKIIGRKPLKKDFRDKKEYYENIRLGILNFYEVGWVLIGLLSNSWFIFAGILIFSITISYFIKPFRYTILHKIFVFMFLLFRLSLYVFVITNHFFLHINLLDKIKWFI